MFLVKYVDSYSANEINYHVVETEEEAKSIMKSYDLEYDNYANLYRHKSHPTKLYGTIVELDKTGNSYHGSELIPDPLYGTIVELKK